MAVSKEQVLATAALCRLDIAVSADPRDREHPEERILRMAAQLDAVVGYMDILNKADTEGVEPLYSPLEEAAPPRPDAAEKRRSVEEILANAPKRQHNFFAVPPVI